MRFGNNNDCGDSAFFSVWILSKLMKTTRNDGKAGLFNKTCDSLADNADI